MLRLCTFFDDGYYRGHYRATLIDTSLGADAYYEPPYQASSTRSYQMAVREVLSDAYVNGVRKVERDGRVVRLRSSPRRRAIMTNITRRRRSQGTRLGIARALVRRLQTQPTPSDVRTFFRRWKEVTGYRPTDDLAYRLRSSLAPAKEAIIRHMLALAEHHGWPVGTQHDATIRNGYSTVIYVDTPHGQASFHVPRGSYTHLAPYPGRWSGRHDSPEVIAAVIGDASMTIQTQAVAA